ncbi:MAG: DNA-binding protein [archaeon]
MQNQELQEQLQLQQQINQLELQVKQLMSQQAISRYNNLKTAHPEKALQSLLIIFQTSQKEKLTHINDEEYKKLLQMMTPQKKEFKITRK